MPDRPTDPNQFRPLFEEHAGFVFRVLKRHGVPERDLDDACQEVFVVVLRQLAGFEGRSSLRTWIYAIAARVALASRRRAHIRHELLDGEPHEQASAAVALDEAAQRQLLALAAEALTTMAEGKREVFVLYELEGLTMAEVAASLQIPEPTVLSRLYAARDEIQRFVHARAGASERRAYAERRTR